MYGYNFDRTGGAFGRDEGCPCGLFARLPGLVRRAGDGGRGDRSRGEDAGRSVASGDAGIFVRQGGEVSGPGVLAGPAAVSDAAAEGCAEGAGLAQGREAEAFERISWDEALDEIAARLKTIAAEFGPESVLPYSYAGTIGQLGYGSMDRRFFHRLGASQLDRTICSTAGGVALTSVYGVKLGTPPEDFAHAGLIIAWGANVHGNNVHLWPFIEEARRKGAKLVVIDPYRTRTAALADEHLAINPGTDAALALGMMHVILREGLEDREYIARCTTGFDELKAHALRAEHSPESVAAATGISAETIVRLARAYATAGRDGCAGPAAIRLNYGIQRSENGGTAARAVCMLPLLTGAWKYKGGGLQLSTSGAFPFNDDGAADAGADAGEPAGTGGAGGEYESSWDRR